MTEFDFHTPGKRSKPDWLRDILFLIVGNSAVGTSTASLTFGGVTSTTKVAVTESWNGTNWTEVNDLNQARLNLGGTGTSTDALAIGGNLDPGNVNSTESWDGTNWYEVNNLNTARAVGTAFGTASSAIYAGGNVGDKNELWNGAIWTEKNDLSVPREGGSPAGTSTAGLFGGGSIAPIVATTEEWNADFAYGVWVTENSLNNIRAGLGS